MEVQVNMLCFLAQLQKKLHLDYKTNITQNHQKIKLYGSLTTKDLKKLHSSRQVGRVETWREVESHGEVVEWAVPHSHVVDKNWEGYSGVKDDSPQTRTPRSPGFQCQEDKFP